MKPFGLSIMDEMGAQKPLGVNIAILNKHIPNKSPYKRSRARKTLDRSEIRNRGRLRYKNDIQELEFLDSMDTSGDTAQQAQQQVQQHQHHHISHSLPPDYDDLQFQMQEQQLQLQLQHNYYSSSPLHQQQVDHSITPLLPPRPDVNSSMLVFNSAHYHNSSPHSPVPIVSGFPSYFNPRQARNMPHSEKVERWMENLPVFFEESTQLTHTDCFNAAEDSDFWEEDEFDNGMDDSIVLTNSVEIIFLQQRRITSLINRLYNTNT